MSRERYIVTGGAGFIGSNLVARLQAEREADVLVLDPLRTGSYANLIEACARCGHEYRGSLVPTTHNEVAWEMWLDEVRPRAVFHLGAITDTTLTDEREMLEFNAMGFESMARACAEANEGAGVPLVYASSAATYGTPAQTARREPFPLSAAGRPNNVYGFSKWMLECAHRRFAEERPDAHIVGLRYFNVFGMGEARKGSMASMAYQLTTQCLAGKRPRLFIDGSQARDQVAVEDVVDCTIAAAGLDGRAITPGVYNLGSGKATSFAQVASAVREGLGLGPGDREIEYFEMPASVRAFYQEFTQADMSETKRGLGWSPTHDPVEATRVYARALACGG